MYKTKLILIAGLSIFLSSSFVNAGSIEKIREDIKRTTRLLEEEKLAHQKDKGHSISAQKSLEERMEVLNGKIENMVKDIKHLDNKIYITGRDKKGLIKDKKSVNEILSDMRGLILGYIEKLEKRTKSEFPYEVYGRRRRLEALRKRLKEDGTALLDIVQEIYVYFIREIEMGENSEIYSDEIETVEGKIKKAKFIRVGRTILAYRTNDGKETGYLMKDEKGYRWEKDLPKRYKRNIRKGIQIMEGKRVPELLEFPVKINFIDKR